jgi:hypothetical protein
MNETPTPKPGWRIGRRVLIALAILATLIAIFYTEEDWRGKRAWENCKSELEAQGVVLDWDQFIPPPAPDDQNFFTASSNILLRFKQHESTNDPDYQMALDSPWLRLNPPPNSFPIFDTSTSGPIVVAKIIVSRQPGLALESNALVISFNDPTAPERARKLIQATMGQTIQGVAGFEFSQFQLTNLQPVKIFVQADTTPSVDDMAAFIPSDKIGEKGQLRLVSTIDPKIYQVQLTNLRITSAADYLAWSDQYVPAFDEIREALKRPDAIIPGDYSQPYLIPIPNFVTMRSLAQTLAQRAQCYLLLDEPANALHELTLVHDVCRILEKPPTGKPETLVEAMINVAISGLYADIIADGLQRRAWQEPQLEALQEQLGQIDLPFFVLDAFQAEPAAESFDAVTIPPQKWFNIWGREKPRFPRDLALWLMPRGWVYQNTVVVAELDVMPLAVFDASTGTISPEKAEAGVRETQKAVAHHSPFNILAYIGIPNFTKAFQVTAYNQTLVNEAQIACALERHYLAHGEYPERLDDLVPQFITAIPHDIIGGQPLHYRRTADGRFQLYSIGWNERDDGGKVRLNENGNVIYTQGDWVWPTAAK